MSHNPTNAAYWRRRALRAEAEVQTMRDIRAVDNSMEIRLASENAALRVAFAEIREVLCDLERVVDMEATS